MSRRGSNPAESGAERHRRRRASDHGAGPEPDEPGSALGIPGISEDALTPELREGLARLTAERNRLRDDLAKARGRISSLERLADEDPLTTVANRRAFVRQLTRMIAFTHRYGVPASVVYFDLNNMKQINDEHGHPTGDAALRHIAAVLRENIRSSDIVGRLGGDEFGVILAQTDEDQAHGKASALAEAIAETPLRAGGHEILLSAAYGVYAFAGTDDPQHAIEAADRAMYQQKRATLAAGL
jgi:diguanylate cyclase (GGDEF)-like protein